MLDPRPNHAAMDVEDTAKGATQEASSGGLAAPVRDRMEQSFGADFSGVRVHEDGEAGKVGAEAFTRGGDLHFAPGRYQPETAKGQELIGHELAHVVQQSQGRVEATAQAKGLDINDDHGLEAEADTLGARAARGEKVADLGGADVAGGFGTIAQCYIEKTLEGTDWRVSDDLKMAIRQDTSDPAYGSHAFFADAALIDSSSTELKGQQSRLSMEAGTETMVVKHGRKKKTLNRVIPKNEKNKTEGNDDMQWPDDCGLAANSIMQGDDRGTKGVFKDKKGKEQETSTVEYGGDSMDYKGNTMHTPHMMLDEILAATLDPDPDKARQKYHAMPKKKREAFDKKHGLNKYADPSIGEAYSIVSDKDEFADGKSAWNFHWGGVCMKAGGDHVTMENFAGSGGDAWDFQMYGSAKKAGQTFHEQQEERTAQNGDDEYGPNPFTIRVRPE